jgi:hypothetical protein
VDGTRCLSIDRSSSVGLNALAGFCSARAPLAACCGSESGPLLAERAARLVQDAVGQVRMTRRGASDHWRPWGNFAFFDRRTSRGEEVGIRLESECGSRIWGSIRDSMMCKIRRPPDLLPREMLSGFLHPIIAVCLVESVRKATSRGPCCSTPP